MLGSCIPRAVIEDDMNMVYSTAGKRCALSSTGASTRKCNSQGDTCDGRVAKNNTFGHGIKIIEDLSSRSSSSRIGSRRPGLTDICDFFNTRGADNSSSLTGSHILIESHGLHSSQSASNLSWDLTMPKQFQPNLYTNTLLATLYKKPYRA